MKTVPLTNQPSPIIGPPFGATNNDIHFRVPQPHFPNRHDRNVLRGNLAIPYHLPKPPADERLVYSRFIDWIVAFRRTVFVPINDIARSAFGESALRPDGRDLIRRARDACASIDDDRHSPWRTKIGWSIGTMIKLISRMITNCGVFFVFTPTRARSNAIYSHSIARSLDHPPNQNHNPHRLTERARMYVAQIY